MSIKDKLLASYHIQAEGLKEEHANTARKQTALEQTRAWIDGMPDLDIPEPDYAAVGQDGNDMFLTYHDKGRAQEAAAQAAIQLGITFKKLLNEYNGYQLYYHRYGDRSIYIDGVPPESCKLESYEVIEKRTCYRVNCEEAAS